MLSTLGRFGATPTKTDAVGVQAMQLASKNILYTVANSNALYTVDERNEMLTAIGGNYSGFSGYEQFALDRGMNPWELTAWIINGAIALLLAGLMFAKVRKYNRLFGKDSDVETVATTATTTVDSDQTVVTKERKTGSTAVE